ncbi:transposable element Tcb1 transposase [Trichonephila clavipes]|nr:transposable element Tcb1 transposase [Trichonephila clavipes]
MTDLSEFEKGMIVGMRCAGCSVTETAIYLGRARSTVSAVMTAYKKCGNVTSGKHNSGWKRKLTDRDNRFLTHIVARKRKQSLSQITSEVNSHLRNPISATTIQRELHASNLYGRVGIRKPLVTARHALQQRQWCRTHRQWTPQQWQQVIWSDESKFTLFQTTGRVYVWRTPKEAFAPECVVPTVKHGGGSLMHEGEVGHLDWPPQSPDLNIIEHLWGYLESKLCARFPPPSTILALDTALHEEWLHIPMLSASTSQYLNKELLGGNMTDFCHPNDLATLKQHLKETFETDSVTCVLHKFRIGHNRFARIKTKSKYFPVSPTDEYAVSTHSVIR